MLENYKVEKIIFGGVGFLSDDFKDVVEEKFKKLKGKIVFSKVSVSGKTGINELIKRGIVEKALKGGRISMETEMVEKFFAEISKDGLAVYGPIEVENAINYGAIKSLLVSEKFISDDPKKAEELLDKAKKMGAKIIIISTKHEAGERFSKIGIGGLLRFKV